ncbi:B12-binding domain-containing radical SAM protein [Patescibacteria group bacterium]
MKRFKVLLINPPYFFNVSAAKVTHLAMGKKPPLGILYLATYLKKYSEFNIKIIDAELGKMTEKDVENVILEFNPDVVGISVVSFKLYSVFKILKIIRKISCKIHICLGGPHLKIYPRETLNYSEVDSIIIGDGEIPFLEVCKNLSESKLIEGINGCYTKKNIPIDGEFVKFEMSDLSILPDPDLTLLDYKKYRSFLTNEMIATVVTSRGCPYNCIFCQLDPKVRLVSISKVVDQIENYLRLGIKEIEFYDETFNISIQRVIEFAEEIINRGLKFNWSFRGRVNVVSEEMLRKIKRAGCQRIQYGVEAGSNRILVAIKKGITVEMIKECFELTRKVGIETVSYFMIGNPGEKEEDIMQTIDFSREIKSDYVNFAIFLLVPGVEAYRMALEQGIINRDYWLEYSINPQESLPMLYWEKELSKDKLMKLKTLAVRKFYFRFNYILNRLRYLSIKNVFGYCRAFYYMFLDAF